MYIKNKSKISCKDPISSRSPAFFHVLTPLHLRIELTTPRGTKPSAFSNKNLKSLSVMRLFKDHGPVKYKNEKIMYNI
jgi:hypothetical protein